MAESPGVLMRCTAQIVEAFLQSERLPADQLPAVLRQVHQALARLGQAEPASAPLEEQKPAVSVRRSIREDRIVCLECGAEQKTLRRHLTTAHGLSPEAYREKWSLPRDYPMVAPAYREQRSAMAKQFGLGNRRKKAPPPAPATAPRAQRGRTSRNRAGRDAA